jgi:hypothetical protein
MDAERHFVRQIAPPLPSCVVYLVKMMEAGYQHQGQHDVQGEQEEYQMQNSFKKIEELENYGINKTDIIKLKAGGYHTIEAVRPLSLCVSVSSNGPVLMCRLRMDR